MEAVRICLISKLISVCFLVACSATADVPSRPFLALSGGTLIDGRGGEPVIAAVVVIAGERILYAGPAAQVEIPGGSEIVDVQGMTILPGFINAHVHGGLSTTRLRAWAREGITTVRDLGSSREDLFAFLSQLPDSPELARLVAAGPLITVPGGYPMVPFGSRSGLPVASNADARQQAEELLDGGADLLKLALESGTVFGQRIPVLPLDRAALLTRIAHGRGTVVSAHITSVVDLPLALDAGADDLAHMAVDRALHASLIQRTVDQGVTWVPTLELWKCVGYGQDLVAVQNLQRFVAGGGTVALGTDYRGYNCQWELGMPMTEIGLMRQAGMTPMQIIVAATANAARVCNLERELGTLEKGKIADMIVVKGNPLDDLGVLAEVALVIRNGTVIKDELDEQHLPEPRRGRRRAGVPDP
jgi:imidazolonepropionase-like amidohydrolase